MKLTETQLRNLIKQELKRFLNVNEAQVNKPRRYSPQEMDAIGDQIMRDEEDELEGRPLDPRSGPLPDPKKFPRRSQREMDAIYAQILTDMEDEDEEEEGFFESKSARSLKEKLARFTRK